MKKTMVFILVLALALAVPVQAWHLFPVKEKPVTENKDNSVSYGVMGGIACLICLIGGIFMGVYMSDLLDDLLKSRVTENALRRVNYELSNMALIFRNNSLQGVSTNGDMFDIDASQIKIAVLNQHRE